MVKHLFRIAPLLLVLTIILLLPACAHKKPVEEKPTGSFLEDVYDTANTDTDLEIFSKAMPPYLQYIESSHAPDAASLCKVAGAFYGHAYCFAEDKDKKEASRLFLKGRDLVITELRRYRIFDNALTFNKSADEFRQSLTDSFDKKNNQYNVIYWAAMNWAGWISLNLDNSEALADIPRAAAMLEFVDEFDNSYKNGSVHAVLGTLYASRSKEDGGDPAKAKEEFDKAFSCSFNSVLTYHVMYAKYYACRVKDKELFRKSLETVIKAPANYRSDMNFMNEVAKKKARFLLDNMDTYFKEPAVKTAEETPTEPQQEETTELKNQQEPVSD